MNNRLDKAADIISKSKKIVAFTGAGISAESGIPPFRGENGIWNKYNPDSLDIDYYYKIRDQFNAGQKDPARMLFILARVVKGAVRYNVDGVMNQSCDKRRYGTKPETVAKNAKAKGIKSVVFDRAGYQYTGRVKALADGARDAGLEF